jgi:hypothetical protein
MEFIETINLNIIKYFLEYDPNIESDMFVKVRGIKDKAEYGYIKTKNNQTQAYIKPILKNLPEAIENINEETKDIDIENKNLDKIIKKSKSKNNNNRFKKKSKLRKKIFI